MNTTILQPNHQGYTEASKLINSGQLVAFPTETVYGLGANALSEQAVAKIYHAKGRPSDNPLIVHFAQVSQLQDIVRYISPTAQLIIEHLMPGSITIVLPKSDKVSPIITAGLDTVAVRMPSSKEAQEFLRYCATPIAAPSANTSSRPSPTRWQDVMEDMEGRIAAVIAGQDCQIGIESTVVDLTDSVPTILRPGIITASEIASVCGCPIKVITNITDKVNSPGVRYKHYAPTCPMVLNTDGDIDKVVAFYNSLTSRGINPVIVSDRAIAGVNNYSWGITDYEIASNLYKALRCCEKQYDYIIAIFNHTDELSQSIANRLLKSSSGNIL